MTSTYSYHSPLGVITLASNGEALTGLWFDGQKYFGDTLPRQHKQANLPIFDETAKWLDIYFRASSRILHQNCSLTLPVFGKRYGRYF